MSFAERFLPLLQMYPPGQDDYFYVMSGIHSHFPMDCFKYNR